MSMYFLRISAVLIAFGFCLQTASAHEKGSYDVVSDAWKDALALRSLADFAEELEQEEVAPEDIEKLEEVDAFLVRTLNWAVSEPEETRIGNGKLQFEAQKKIFWFSGLLSQISDADLRKRLDTEVRSRLFLAQGFVSNRFGAVNATQLASIAASYFWRNRITDKKDVTEEELSQTDITEDTLEEWGLIATGASLVRLIRTGGWIHGTSEYTEKYFAIQLGRAYKVLGAFEAKRGPSSYVKAVSQWLANMETQLKAVDGIPLSEKGAAILSDLSQRSKSFKYGR